MTYFKDKVVIVTGSSGGIGKELARQLLGFGGKVVLNGRNESRLRETQRELSEFGETAICAGSVAEEDVCRRLVRTAINCFGKLDVLINNAGVSMEGEIENVSPSVFRNVIETNYLGSVFATQAAIPYLRETKGGVYFVSSAAAISGLPRFSVYSSSKMALRGLAESLRIELAGTGVYVGLGLLGFTENDPRKVILGPNGNTIPQPNRDFIPPQSVELTAKQILSAIERKKSKSVFTGFGKLMAAVQWLAPWLVRSLVSYQYRKRYLCTGRSSSSKPPCSTQPPENRATAA